MESEPVRAAAEADGFACPRQRGVLRSTGIELIGEVPWGTHFCQFYQTDKDLIETLVPYFKAGLESNEFCMWVTSEPLGVEDAKQALRAVVPDLDARLSEGQIEIIPHTEWYLKDGCFDQQRVLNGWVDKLNEALDRGYDGLRLTGNTFWLEKGDWNDFTQYEEAINHILGDYRMLALCTYSLDRCGAGEVADVVANHEFAIMKRRGEWTVIESSTVKQAKQALHVAINDTQQLNEELRVEISEREKREEELRRVNRTLLAHNKSTRAMMRAQDESEYLDEVCRIVAEDCGHAMVWIGYADDDEYKLVRPVAYSGFEEGYLETLKITWADTERGRGPTGTAVRTGRPSMCRNMLIDPQFEPWREQALERGYASSIVLPLSSKDRVWGALTIYCREPDPFSEDEVELLSSLADDLAYGITAIRLAAKRRQAEEALEKYRVLAQSARDIMLFVGLDGKIVEANRAAVLAYGYTHEEMMALSVFDLRAPETPEITAAQMAEADSGGVLFETTHRRQDGSLVPVEVSSRGTDIAGQRVLVSIIRDITERRATEQQRAELYEREHHIAEMLQAALLPSSVPKEVGGLRIGVGYKAALREAEVGGDFYDVFNLGDGRIGVLIGDVAGKGLKAAVRVSAARHSVRSYAFIDPRPSHVLTLANEALWKDSTEECNMLTAFFAVVDAATGRVTYSTAGHEPPLICRASGSIRELNPGEMPLAVLGDTVYTEHSIDLAPGDTIVVVTDGITEARAPGMVMFGKKGMVEFLSNSRTASPDETAKRLMHAAVRHAGGKLQDDAAVVVMTLECEKQNGVTHG